MKYFIEWFKWRWFNFKCNRGWGAKTLYRGQWYIQSPTIKMPAPDYRDVIGMDFGYPDKEIKQ